MSTVARDLRDALTTCLGSEAGAEYNELKYLNDVSQNHSRLRRGYGVRPSSTIEVGTEGTTKNLTYTQTFEFVLAKAYKESALGDSSKFEAFLDLHDIALRFNNKVYNTKAGLPSRVLNVVNLTLDEPAFLDEDKVTVLTGNIDIIYRLTL